MNCRTSGRLKRSMRSLLFLACALACLEGPAVARSGPPPSPEAKAHFVAGDRAFKLGNFKSAVEEYQKSYELSSATLLLYDIAQAYRMLGENEKALFSYKQF